MLEAIHGIYGGLLFLLCWIVLKPIAVLFGALSVGFNAIANWMAAVLDWLENKLL